MDVPLTRKFMRIFLGLFVFEKEDYIDVILILEGDIGIIVVIFGRSLERIDYRIWTLPFIFFPHTLWFTVLDRLPFFTVWK